MFFNNRWKFFNGKTGATTMDWNFLVKDKKLEYTPRSGLSNHLDELIFYEIHKYIFDLFVRHTNELYPFTNN